jgi:myo-inositol-1(or 4)-monophosphatase
MSTPVLPSLARDRAAEYLAFATTLAADAAAIAVAQFGASRARRKADGTIVTATDEQIDRMISQRVQEVYPGDTVLSEEQATFFHPAVERTWVIDPVDGTTNFARGLLTWGVSVALLVGGAPLVGVLHFPLLHEIYAAVAGQGATRNGEPIRTATDAPLDDSCLFMECTRTRRRFTFALPLKTRMLGSAAYHICKVAEGSAMAGSEATPKVWDIAAAALILTEAGGVLRTVTGEAVFPLRAEALDYQSRSYPILYAADESTWQQVQRSMRPVRRGRQP